MKRLPILCLAVMAAVAFTGCKDSNFKTTSTGLKYKLIEGGSKDSTKVGDILKMHITQKVSGSKDTTVYESYGKAPMFQPVQALPQGQPVYGPEEVFGQLKKGDSLIAILYVDSLLKKNIIQEAQLPPYVKKGDKVTFTYKVLEVFKSDSLARIDYQKEMEKDAPRQQQEQKELMEKMQKEAAAKQKLDDAELEKSGEKAKQIQTIEAYLKSKNIHAVKTALGTFVKVEGPGTGAQVTDNKFVTVKYTGKKVTSDSTFDGPGSFTLQIGKAGVIRGFEDGLRQFKEGGKGVIYVPGFLAYGKTPPPGSPFKAYEPLYFEVEIVKVADNNPQAQMAPGHGANDGHGH